jgi:hypothetical protein
LATKSQLSFDRFARKPAVVSGQTFQLSKWNYKSLLSHLLTNKSVVLRQDKRNLIKSGPITSWHNPNKGLTDADVTGRHMRRPEQVLQFAGVIAHWLHIIGGDLQQPASALAMAT